MKFFKIYIPTPLGILIIVIEVFIAVLIMNFMVNDMQKELMPEMDNIKTIISHQTTNANVNQAVDTADWQSYENKGYKYKIKYPEIGSIKEAFTYGKNESEVSPRVSDIQIVIGEAGSENMILQVYPIDTNLDEHIYDLTPDKDVINRGTETIDGLVMKSLVINGYLTRKSDDIIHESIKLYPRNKVLFIEKDNYVYRFILGKIIEPNLSLKKNDLRIMNQIVATFQFTDETVGWQTYSNTKYGFSFKYPKSWKLTEYKEADGGINPSDGVAAEDQNGKDGKFIWLNKGVIPYQDGEWTSVQNTITVDGKTAIKTSYTAKNPESFAIKPTKRSIIHFSSTPTGWDSEADLGLIDGTSDASDILDQILSTFQFTD